MCIDCAVCHGVFVLLLFASTLDQRLRRPQTDKQVDLSVSRFLLVSLSECWRLPEPEPQMHGVVKSPKYPQPYPPDLQEQWDLSVPEGYRIRLTFTHLDIEASEDCHFDSVTVRAAFLYEHITTLL